MPHQGRFACRGIAHDMRQVSLRHKALMSGPLRGRKRMGVLDEYLCGELIIPGKFWRGLDHHRQVSVGRGERGTSPRLGSQDGPAPSGRKRTSYRLHFIMIM